MNPVLFLKSYCIRIHLTLSHNKSGSLQNISYCDIFELNAFFSLPSFSHKQYDPSCSPVIIFVMFGMEMYKNDEAPDSSTITGYTCLTLTIRDTQWLVCGLNGTYCWAYIFSVFKHIVKGAHRTATCKVWRYQTLYNTILTSWWWAQQSSKHVEAYNKLNIKQEVLH